MNVLTPAFVPEPWTNAPLVLYHGTVDAAVPAILRKVEFPQSRARTDFGRGFCTTTTARLAFSWAWHQLRRYRGRSPAVIRFDVGRDELARSDTLWFIRGGFDAESFWRFVFHCRGDGVDHGRAGPQRWYDVVVGLLVASWTQRLAFLDADQISFPTEQAVALLNRSNPRRIR